MIEVPQPQPLAIDRLHEPSGWSQVDVDWDNGRSLMLSMPPDEIERVEPSN